MKYLYLPRVVEGFRVLIRTFHLGTLISTSSAGLVVSLCCDPLALDFASLTRIALRTAGHSHGFHMECLSVRLLSVFFGVFVFLLLRVHTLYPDKILRRPLSGLYSRAPSPLARVFCLPRLPMSRNSSSQQFSFINLACCCLCCLCSAGRRSPLAPSR